MIHRSTNQSTTMLLASHVVACCTNFLHFATFPNCESAPIVMLPQCSSFFSPKALSPYKMLLAAVTQFRSEKAKRKKESYESEEFRNLRSLDRNATRVQRFSRGLGFSLNWRKDPIFLLFDPIFLHLSRDFDGSAGKSRQFQAGIQISASRQHAGEVGGRRSSRRRTRPKQ